MPLAVVLLVIAAMLVVLAIVAAGNAITVQVHIWHLREMVNSVEDGDRHATREVGLDVAVEYKGSGILHLVPDHDERGLSARWNRSEAVSQRWVYQVEELRYRLDRLFRCAPVEGSWSHSDDISLVAVLM